MRIDANEYWSEPFYSIFSIKNASLMTIVEIESTLKKPLYGKTKFESPKVNKFKRD